MNWVIRGLICGLLVGHAPALLAADAMPFGGGVQFWERTCEGLRCGLPEAIGARHPVSGELAAPGGAGSIGTQVVRLAEGNLHLELQLYWPAPPNGSKSFLVAQARIFTRDVDGVDRPIGECSQYSSQDVARFFPVGACAGFVAAEDGRHREVGVTFYKQ